MERSSTKSNTNVLIMKKSPIDRLIFGQFTWKKGMPIRFKMNNEEVQGLFFKKIDKTTIQCLLINNSFSESDKIIVKMKDVIS